MATFEVISKQTGQMVYAYQAVAMCNTEAYPLNQYDHVQVQQPQAAPGTEKATTWLIDLGPFFDRLGMVVGMAVDMSADPVVQAVKANFSRRKWIDLKDGRVAAGLDILISRNVHPNMTDELKDEVLNTPVAHVEQAALLATYGGALNGG